MVFTEIKGLNIFERSDEKALVLEFIDYKLNKFNGIIRLELSRTDLGNLLLYLEGYVTKFGGRDIVPCNQAYSEEISYYKDDIERSLTINRGRSESDLMIVCLSCYTDIEYNDYWLDLTPGRIKSFIELIHGYVSYKF